MSDPVILALIAAVSSMIASITAAVVAILTNRKVEMVHKATNSMKDELVAVTRSDALQTGRTEGIAEQKAEQRSEGRAEDKR